MTSKASVDVTTPSRGVLPPPGGRPFSADQKVFVALAATFVTCLILGDVTGGKAFDTGIETIGIGSFRTKMSPISVGMVLFPVTFLLTDVVNDFYGKRVARFLTAVGAAMATLAYFALVLTTALPTHPDSFFPDEWYARIFGGSSKLFIASILAYLVGQVLDIQVFAFWKKLTRGRHLWLRATGSTLLSQLVDTSIINAIFWGGVADKTTDWIVRKIVFEYLIKVIVAILLTPVVYAIHSAIVRIWRLPPVPHEE